MKAFAKVADFGFRSEGSCFRSIGPVDNAQTRFVRQVISQLHAKPHSPAEVVGWIESQPDYIRSMFSPLTILDWSKRHAYREWRGASRARSAESAIIDRGRGQPLWLENEPLWESRIAEAERLRPDLRLAEQPSLPWDPTKLALTARDSPTLDAEA